MTALPRRSAWLVLGALLALPAMAARADDSSRTPNAATVAALQERFPSGRLARVKTVHGDRIVVSPSFLAEGLRDVDSSGVVRLTSWSEIQRIDARGGSPARGGLVGAIVGGAGGIGIGFIVALGDEDTSALTNILGAGAILATAGAIVGAVVGSAFPGWVKVYPGRLDGGSSWGLGRRNR